ncbi:DUF4373 domain-containing protein [Clostridium tyrobutyricum]|nr:DUF4373 domain-containing protein [Clostridium tyrobutyricum]
MKETYYFLHDYNARNDPKIPAMISKYGAEGYGYLAFIRITFIYRIIIEFLSQYFPIYFLL